MPESSSLDDLHQYSRAGRGTGLIHDVLDVLLHSQLANGDRIGDLLVRVAFHEMLDDLGLATRKMKLFLGPL